MLNENFPKEITDLIYINRGLKNNEINYIKKMLKLDTLRNLVNLRYAPDPIRYGNMKKNELLNELKYSRYDDN